MCAKHIYSNWHKKQKGDFDDQLKILEEMGATATDDLMTILPLHWSRIMLEEIRKMIMQRMHVKRSWVEVENQHCSKGSTEVGEKYGTFHLMSSGRKPTLHQGLNRNWRKIWNFPLNVDWFGMVMEDLK
ncbi:hypothetical protein GQ457_09G013680 [Hibiscus cannabinus]